MSLLREIQSDLAGPTDIATVLRKCKILAARLGSEPFSRWVDLELGGYPESEPTPEYRRLAVNGYANFMNIAWRATEQPILWFALPEEVRDAHRHIDFRDGIAKAALFAQHGARIDRPELGPLLQGKMFPDMNCVGAWLVISASEFGQLVSGVKNRILDFVLKIEAANPDAGEATPNSQPVPQNQLQPLVQNFFAAVGNVAQSGQNFSQTATIGINAADLSRLVLEFRNHLDELTLEAGERKSVQAQLATLDAQLIDAPDPIVVAQVGRTLRSITEGAIGSLLATAVQPTVWQWIHEMLAKLAH